ncbi:hypothetical protein DY000_02029950 [Brassica cretica]|uniref:Uncharacterized protein n=1 Tax=Brassica cretica TaxID=69181 RepID=A0ABQ7DYP6_BRACR|nr:hypothetical protein DY000_02029950 [Brassica cretica]
MKVDSMPQYPDYTFDSMNHQLEHENPCSHHPEEGSHEPRRSASFNGTKPSVDDDLSSKQGDTITI